MTPLIVWLGLTLAQDDVAERLRDLDSNVLPAPLPAMIGRDASSRVAGSNRRESEAWGKIKTGEDWERYRDVRLRALRDSLGAAEPVPADLKVSITRTLEGRGHRVENLVYESRPGLLVTANLYVPVPEQPSMPAIVIV